MKYINLLIVIIFYLGTGYMLMTYHHPIILTLWLLFAWIPSGFIYIFLDN